MQVFPFNGHEYHFEHPAFLSWWAVLLLLVLVVAVRGLLDWFARSSLRRSYADPAQLDRTTRPLSLAGHAASTFCWFIVGVLLLIALAYPFEHNQPVRVPEGSTYAVVAFDGSPSADAEDYRDVLPTPALPDGTHPKPIGPWGSRGQVSRWITVNQLMAALPGNKMGFVAYTADARVASPLREDYGTLRWILTQTTWLTAPGGGSDPSEALKAALQALRKQYTMDQEAAGKPVKMKRQIIFLFTDGGISDLEKERSEDDKAIWERDFQTVLKDLAGLRAQAEKDGTAPPLVVLIGVGGEEAVPVPLYYTDGERVRNENGEPEFFPMGKEPQRTRLEEANILMLQQRIGAVVECKYQRIPMNWTEVERIKWVEDVIGGEKTTLGKRYYWDYPLLAAMTAIGLLFLRGRFRPSDEIVARRGLPNR